MSISRMHARLTVLQNGKYLLEDLDSKAGTFVQRDGSWQKVSSMYVDRETPLRFADVETTVGRLLGAGAPGAQPDDRTRVLPVPLSPAMPQAYGGRAPYGQPVQPVFDAGPYAMDPAMIGGGERLAGAALIGLVLLSYAVAGIMERMRYDEQSVFIASIILGIIMPLILWLAKRDESPFVDQTGKQIINLYLTAFIAFIIPVILLNAPDPGMIYMGIWLVIGLYIGILIFLLIALVQAARGHVFEYPLTIRLMK